jgi:ATP-dependent DNA helicase RecG
MADTTLIGGQRTRGTERNDTPSRSLQLRIDQCLARQPLRVLGREYAHWLGKQSLLSSSNVRGLYSGDGHGRSFVERRRRDSTAVRTKPHFCYHLRQMSASPIRFPGREKEAPFDVAPLRKIVLDLLVQSVEEVESEELEIKGWCKTERELADKVAEACACIANTVGGHVLVGVTDGPNVRRKFSACPHSVVNTSWLQTKVHDLTKPPVECFPFDASGILAEVIGSSESNLYALRVPRTRCISGHTTKGISKVRIGKQCQPHYLAEDDRTNVSLPHISVEDLSSTSIDWAIAQHQKHFKTSATWADKTEFLAQARLVEPYLLDEEYLARFQPSFAALLLFGKASAIERNVPFFETIAVADKAPVRIRKNVIESVRELCVGEGSILRSRLPQVPPEVLKELLVNAYIHRCYRTPSPVMITISEWGLEIKSPGELLAGLNVNNLIYGVPVYRNLLLADGARFSGLCDKIGQGIDLIFQGVLSGGLAFPEFESSNNSFIARILLGDSSEFKEFVRRRSQTLSQLDEVIVLRVLWGKEGATLEELSSKMQRKPEFAQRILLEMCKKMIIEITDNVYRLTAVVRRDIETIFRSDQLSFDLSQSE